MAELRLQPAASLSRATPRSRTPSGPDGMDRWLALGLGTAAAGLWIVAAAPGITWLDTAELAAAGYDLGLSHPPGQPLHAMAAKAACLIPLGPIAFRCNVLSAILGGLCVAALVQLARALMGRQGLRVGLVAGGCMALSWAMTEQAVRTEVYTLVCALVLIAATAVARMRPAEGDGARPWPLSRACVIAGFCLSLAFATHPLIAATAAVALGVTAVWLLAVRRVARPALYGLAAIGLGAFVWVYLPLADTQRATVVFADPSSLEGFWQTVTARAYAANVTGPPVGLHTRLGGHLLLLAEMGGWVILILSAVAATVGLARKKTRFAAAVLAGLFATGLGGCLMLKYFFPANPDLHGYLLPCLAAACLLGAWTVQLVPQTPFGSTRARQWIGATVAFAILVSVGIKSADRTADRISHGHEASELAFRAGSVIRPGPALAMAGSDHLLFSLLYAQAAEGWRPDVAVAGNWLVGSTAHWYRHHLKRRFGWLFVPFLDDGGTTVNMRRRFLSVNAQKMPAYVERPDDAYGLPVADCGVLFGVRSRTRSAASGVCVSKESFPRIDGPEIGRLVDCHVSTYRSRYLAAHGQFNAALEELAPHLRKEPSTAGRWKASYGFFCSSADPHVLAGQILLVRGQVRDAESAFRKAIKLDARHPSPWVQLGRLSGMEGRFKRAERFLRKALHLSADNVEAHFYLALTLSRLGRLDEAKRIMARAQRLDRKLIRRLIQAHSTRRKAPR